MNPFFLTVCFGLAAAPAGQVTVSLPPGSQPGRQPYVTYHYETKDENWYFLVERKSRTILAIEFNAQHDDGESWLDADSDDVRTTFKLSGGVDLQTIKLPLPISPTAQNMLRKVKKGQTVQINGKSFTVKTSWPGFSILQP